MFARIRKLGCYVEECDPGFRKAAPVKVKTGAREVLKRLG